MSSQSKMGLLFPSYLTLRAYPRKQGSLRSMQFSPNRNRMIGRDMLRVELVSKSGDELGKVGEDSCSVVDGYVSGRKRHRGPCTSHSSTK